MANPMISWNKVEYFLWAARNCIGANRSCPACGSGDTTLIKRKALVTSLYCCEACHLLFRVPKSNAGESEVFYQKQYRQGFTTDCPDDAELEYMKQKLFRGTEKDYTTYISVLRSVGLRPGQVLFDLGASWGYGSWQLMQAGYRVYSYEISKPRARYAEEKLGCHMLPDLEHVPEKADCFFAAHVIEHLSNPLALWETALKMLKSGGVVVLFTPNGEPSRECLPGNRYHQLWGQAECVKRNETLPSRI
jgi:D-arabinose 1-dehydrogenase-like Zn-dependent alcohol dehydrogenase